jgi:hypothetical protein
MFSAIRKRMTYANVAMTLALVFAMTGGAYAASKYLITSTKQISPKVLKQLHGKNGKNGLNGANGINGKDGAAGAQGLQGIQGLKGQGIQGLKGDNGVSVTGTPIAAGASEPCGEAGGTAYTSASGTEKVCNGKEGTQGPPGPQEITVLPTGSRETGQWAVLDRPTVGGPTTRFYAISFPIELKSEAHAHFIGPKEGAGETLEKLPEEEEIVNGSGNGIMRKVCTGNIKEPTAEIAGPSVPGELCVYTRFIGPNTAFNHFNDIEKSVNGFAGKTGTMMVFETVAEPEGLLTARGTWAVTGP